MPVKTINHVATLSKTGEYGIIDVVPPLEMRAHNIGRQALFGEDLPELSQKEYEKSVKDGNSEFQFTSRSDAVMHESALHFVQRLRQIGVSIELERS